MSKVDPIIDKTTVVKTSERIKLKAIPFAKGYKIQVEWAFNPDNSYHLDQVIKWESSDMRKGMEAFINNIIVGELHGIIIHDKQ
jgi:hypothetical protein